MGRRGPCAFRQCDVERAIKAARAAGLEVARVEIHKDGKIIVITGKPPEAAALGDDLDKWLAKHARQA
jgi:hypothetical protein